MVRHRLILVDDPCQVGFTYVRYVHQVHLLRTFFVVNLMREVFHIVHHEFVRGHAPAPHHLPHSRAVLNAAHSIVLVTKSGAQFGSHELGLDRAYAMLLGGGAFRGNGLGDRYSLESGLLTILWRSYHLWRGTTAFLFLSSFLGRQGQPLSHQLHLILNRSSHAHNRSAEQRPAYRLLLALQFPELLGG